MTYFQRQTLPATLPIRFVPQQQAWIVERMGKFHRILNPGLSVLLPPLDKIRYVQTLKETAIQLEQQAAITIDNVTLHLDGVLFVKVIDPYKASYGIDDAQYAVSQLAQTTMRSEIGKLSLQQVLRERQSLNERISAAINEAAEAWGVRCLRHEIKDISPPQDVLASMHRQVSAERQKRAEILESEGHRQAEINRADGEKQMKLLHAEGVSQSIALISKSISDNEHSQDATSLLLAQSYVSAFEKLAKEGTSVVVPAKLDDIGSMVAGGLSVFENIKNARTQTPAQSTAEALSKP